MQSLSLGMEIISKLMSTFPLIARTYFKGTQQVTDLVGWPIVLHLFISGVVDDLKAKVNEFYFIVTF